VGIKPKLKARLAIWQRSDLLLALYSVLPSSATAVLSDQCKGIQDSLGFWIPRRGYRIPVTGFQPLTIESGFWIPIVNWIPNSLSCSPETKA